jgi:NhaP-type Na+/H+ and K+/H+ antiporter
VLQIRKTKDLKATLCIYFQRRMCVPIFLNFYQFGTIFDNATLGIRFNNKPVCLAVSVSKVPKS